MFIEQLEQINLATECMFVPWKEIPLSESQICLKTQVFVNIFSINASIFTAIYTENAGILLPKLGPSRELNPGPRAPEAQIIPLDHLATHTSSSKFTPLKHQVCFSSMSPKHQVQLSNLCNFNEQIVETEML